MKKLKLNSETEIPVLGFGTWQIIGEECVNAVKAALEVGYRHIDTADAYGNHTEVAQAIQESGIRREELFLTTKVFYPDLDKNTVLQKAAQFLHELQTEYIDLLLVHWPNKAIPVEETLQAMHSLKEQGKIRAIGVSNFTIQHLEKALQAGIEITNNQVELHPSFNQQELRNYCKSKNITVTAYSPLAQGADLEIPFIKELAEKYKATPSQVILNWLISQDIITVPKSATPERIEENFKAIELKIDADDIERINQLPQGQRIIVPGFAEFGDE
jgi:2,5-diketo-D-gluconate reductase B